MANGFISDDRGDPVRHLVTGPMGRSLILQENSHRGTCGVPLRLPAELAHLKLSPLDLRAVKYASRFRQYPDLIRINGRVYAGLTSPYGFGGNATTIASTAPDDPQGWTSPDRFHRIVLDQCEISRRANGFVFMYNGDGAGATIPQTLHFSAIERHSAMWPLEAAAASAEMARGEQVTVIEAEDLFPLAAVRIQGDVVDVAGRAAKAAVRWHAIAGSDATENVIVSARDGVVALYYVPRSRKREFARFKGVEIRVGSLETLGEVVTETSPADPALRRFEGLCGLLRAARPDGVALRC